MLKMKYNKLTHFKRLIYVYELLTDFMESP